MELCTKKKSEIAQIWARWRFKPRLLGGPHCLARETKSELAKVWARWLHNPYLLRFPVPYTGKNQHWPNSRHGGDIIPPRRQGICRYLVHVWALSYFLCVLSTRDPLECKGYQTMLPKLGP